MVSTHWGMDECPLGFAEMRMSPGLQPERERVAGLSYRSTDHDDEICLTPMGA